MKKYTHILIGDKSHIVEVCHICKNEKKFIQYCSNALHVFNNPNILWQGEQFEGTKTESEIEIGWQAFIFPDWIDCVNEHDANATKELGGTIRKVARPKDTNVPESKLEQKASIEEVMRLDEKDGLYNNEGEHNPNLPSINESYDKIGIDYSMEMSMAENHTTLLEEKVEEKGDNEEPCQYPSSVQQAIGLLDFIRHELDYLPDNVYERIDNTIHRLECEFDDYTPLEVQGKELSDITDEDLKELAVIFSFHDGDGLLIDRTENQISMYDRHNEWPNTINTLIFHIKGPEIFSLDENGKVFNYDMVRFIEAYRFLESKGYKI